MTSDPTSTPLSGRPQRRLGVRHVAAAVVALLAIALVSVGFSPIGQRFFENADAAPPVTGVDEVQLRDSRFDPASIEVAAGTTVTWVWVDGEDHNVVFDDGPASDVIATGTYTRTFEEPGEYVYTCTLHAFMDGRVVVTDG